MATHCQRVFAADVAISTAIALEVKNYDSGRWLSWLKVRVWVRALGLSSFSPVATSFQDVKLATCTSCTPACKHSLT